MLLHVASAAAEHLARWRLPRVLTLSAGAAIFTS